MAEIIKEILKFLPADKISDAAFEAANIVLYTKDKEFFLNNEGLIRQVVNEFKKRIELRPDPSITLAQEKAEKQIRSIMPEEAGISQVLFDPQRSMVIVEAEKPGLAIGKQGSLLREVREKTLWVPVRRSIRRHEIYRREDGSTEVQRNVRRRVYVALDVQPFDTTRECRVFGHARAHQCARDVQSPGRWKYRAFPPRPQSKLAHGRR